MSPIVRRRGFRSRVDEGAFGLYVLLDQASSRATGPAAVPWAHTKFVHSIPKSS